MDVLGCDNENDKIPVPIFIPNILNEILSYIPDSKLKAFRCVSLQWAEEGWKHLRKNAVLRINDIHDLENIRQHFASEKNNICVNIRFLHFEWPVIRSDIFLQFANDYGHLIRYIHLDFKTSIYNKDEHELKSTLFGLFPAMEELVVDFQEPDMGSLVSSTLLSSIGSAKDSSTDKYPLKLDNLKSLRLKRIFREEDGRFVMKMLKSAPNLKCVSIAKDSVQTDGLVSGSQTQTFIPFVDFLDVDDAGYDNIVIRAFRVLRRNGNFTTSNMLLTHYFLNDKDLKLNNILHLNFHMLVTNDRQLQAFKSLQCLSLKTLNLVIIPSLTLTELQSLIYSFSESLESLHLSLNTNNQSSCSPEYQNFQLWDSSIKWKNLKLLCLRNIQPVCLEFLDTMPKLATLLLCGSNFSSLMLKQRKKAANLDTTETLVADVHQQYSSLNSLIIHRDKTKRWTMQTVLTMTNSFTNLKKLKLEHLKDSGLRVIFSSLLQLENLFLMSEHFTDCGVTGLKPDVCKKLQKSGEKPTRRNWPYISNLTKLRKLEIASPEITDVSIVHGVADCKQLRRLFLHSPNITSKSVRKIVDYMNLAVLEIEFCQLLSDSVIRYAKKNFMTSEDVQINTQGLSKNIEMKQYFRTRAANFLMWD